MKRGNVKIKKLIPGIVFIAFALIAEWIYHGDFEYRFRTRRFNRILWEKERIMAECLNGIKPLMAQEEVHGSGSETRLLSTAEEQRITILEYMGNRLTYWSDTDFDVPRVLADSIYTRPFVFIQNGWFVTATVEAGFERLIGLMRIISDYGFENDIIRNGFVKDFRLPEGTGFSREINASEYLVYTSEGTFLFSLLFPETKTRSFFMFLPLLLWMLTFFFLVWTAFYLAAFQAKEGKRTGAIITGFIIFTLLYLAVLLGKPAVLFQTELFSPYRYTMNALVPSLGHLFVLSILLAAFSFLCFKNINKTGHPRQTNKPGYFLFTLLLLPGSLMISLYHVIFSHLVFNSNISFETYKVLELTNLSLAGFVAILLLLSVPFVYLLSIFKRVGHPSSALTIVAIFTAAIPILLFFFNDWPVMSAAAVFWLILVILVWLLQRLQVGRFNRTVIFSMVYGIYSLFMIMFYSEKRTEENVKIQLVTYSTENDPTAEHLLLDMWPRIRSDSVLRNMMDVVYFQKEDADNLYDYLITRYFNGYWGNFIMNMVLCVRGDSLSLAGSDQTWEDCFDFFEQKVFSSGNQLTGTEFYFIDSKQGRSSYFGRLIYEFNDSRVLGLFIDLYSDIKVFQPGYPELLLDKKYQSYARLKDYSFAKYINGEIVLNTGDYSYDKTDAAYIGITVDYRFFKADSYEHALFRNGNVTVIISRPVISFQNIIISFAYLFAFVLIFSNLMLLIVEKPGFKIAPGLNFRQKMQLSFISILLFSFILIGIVIVTLAIKQYQNRHYDNMREKLISINHELENIISAGNVPESEWSNSNSTVIEALLVRLSNIFNTDINLFDPEGYLIATSRPEIYYRNLIAGRMHNRAAINIVNLRKSQYFQTEKIGNLEYVSAYVPIYNADKELIVFLNLPYFRMQSVLAGEISNMIVAVVNFTLLLIVVSMGLAVFISGRLTSPLTLLSSRLASVELGKKSEHLTYRGNDEVGDLVRQYNRMVDELDASAKKLANSEREYAWREMAKQVAHEIKNPLTPMKLNIQQLFKSWTDGMPGFEKKLERFTRNQIEYIDNLSSIASAFSSFAKIPEANPVAVDILEQVKTTIELFKSSDNISFRIGCPYDERIYIYADKEQIKSVLSNLIKNGIQSIRQGKEGMIRVNIEKRDDTIVVSVSDNGSGIPEPLQEKMFTPNFTTKSSGTGLGLSIVKRYVENAGGRIWFESATDKGSVFYIEFPVMK